MTRRTRSTSTLDRRLSTLEIDARQEPPTEVRGVTAEWVSYDTDGDTGDELAAGFVVVDGSAGE
jgi:hypothetical protein